MSKLETTATRAKAALEGAKQKVEALARAAKIGPPTQIEAAKEAVVKLAAASKEAQAKLTAGAKAQKAEQLAAAKSAREAGAAEKARAREAVAAARERARAIVAAERQISAATKAASEEARAAMADRVDDAKRYERALAAARGEAEQLGRAQQAWKGRALSVAGQAGRSALGGAARAVGGAALGAVTGAAAVGGKVLHEVVGRGADFAQQRATLANRLGSREAADERIAELRSTRGISTSEGIAATNRLEGLGLNSSVRSVKALAAIGANTPGKGTGDAAEALADAGTGEFERLKELGFKAKVEGDKVAVTFKGVTELIDKGSVAFQEYFTRIAEAKLGDSLELKASSLGGAVETLQDKITQAASAVYDSGLGDALQEIVKEIGEYFNISGEGAKGLGGVLAEAVKKLWGKVKELIGPVGELPDKIRKVIEVAMSFAEIVMKIVGVLGDVVGALGTTNTAFVALGAAGLMAFGPWGAAAAAAVAAISLIGDALRDTTAEAKKLADETTRVAQTKMVSKQLSGDLGEDEEHVARLRAGVNKRKAETKRASGILSPKALKAEQEKRALDLVEIEKQEAEIAAVEAKIGKKKRDAQRAVDDEADKARAAELATAAAESQKISDTEEFAYLSRKKHKRPSDKTRLRELSKSLDKEIPGKGKGAHKAGSAFEADIDGEIKKRAQDSGRVAGLRALHGGATASEAEAVAHRTEKEVTGRLRTQVDKGGLLPGQVNAGLLAMARVDDVAGRGTPPPIAVTNLGPITINPTVTVSGNRIDGDARQIEVAVRRIFKGSLVEETREAMRRITSKVTK